MTIIPPRDESDAKASGVQLPSGMWQALGEIATLTGWSRNKVIEFLLRWGIDEWNRSERPKLAKKK